MSNEIKMVSIENLYFDMENPRIPKSVKILKDPDKVLEWMLKKENITDLMMSIGEKGYFPAEPILIIPNHSEVGKYVVVEGNRRYSATYLLSYPERSPILKSRVSNIALDANFHPEEIPCLEFEYREDVLDYLGYRHITGVEAWDALAKARYLKQISVQYDGLDFASKCKKLANAIGSKPHYVRQLLVGLDVFELIEENDYFDIDGLDDRTFEFGTFYTAISKTNISNYTKIDFDKESPSESINIENLEKVIHWIFEKGPENKSRVGESRNLVKLDKILDPNYSNALNAFENDGVSIIKAAELTDEADEIVSKKIRSALEEVKIAWEYIPNIKKPELVHLDSLQEINKFLRSINQAVKARLEQDELDI